MSPVSMSYVADNDRFSILQRVIRGRMPELDGLRGIAVILVVWHNVTAGQYTGGVVAKLINLFANTGWIGVQLFFVLSGFLITGILLDEKHTPRQARNFYMRRFLRIFPLYYCTLAVIFILLPALHVARWWLVHPEVNQLWYWFFLNNWSSPFLGDVPALGHFWSLAVEEQFYLLWPACVIFASRRTLLVLCLVLIVSAPAIRLALTVVNNPELAISMSYKFTIARWDALAVGALIALVVRGRDWFNTTRKLVPIALYGAAAYIVIFIAINKSYAASGASEWFNQTAAAVLFAALLFCAIQPSADNKLALYKRLVTHGSLRSAGKYSYAIYVAHMPMIFTLSPLWRSYAFNVAQRFPTFYITALSIIVFAASYVLAYCSWCLLERPCLQLRRFFVANKRVVVV